MEETGMRIGICDDMQIDITVARKTIEDYLNKHDMNYEIKEYRSSKELLDEQNTLEIIFLDIDLGNDNGVRLAKDIHEKWKYCQIVFLTQYVDYVSDVYATEHAYFVLKDHLSEHIGRIFDIVLHKYTENQSRVYFELPHGHIIALSPNDIIYIERHTRKSIIHTKHKTYEIDAKISTIMKQMEKHDFGRCHNSFIVSFNAVTEVQVDHLMLLEKIEIPISRNYRKKFTDDFTSFATFQLP